ncbi:unnamed protein product [Arctogadus glacialis]
MLNAVDGTKLTMRSQSRYNGHPVNLWITSSVTGFCRLVDKNNDNDNDNDNNSCAGTEPAASGVATSGVASPGESPTRRRAMWAVVLLLLSGLVAPAALGQIEWRKKAMNF